MGIVKTVLTIKFDAHSHTYSWTQAYITKEKQSNAKHKPLFALTYWHDNNNNNKKERERERERSLINQTFCAIPQMHFQLCNTDQMLKYITIYDIIVSIVCILYLFCFVHFIRQAFSESLGLSLPLSLFI